MSQNQPTCQMFFLELKLWKKLEQIIVSGVFSRRFSVCGPPQVGEPIPRQGAKQTTRQRSTLTARNRLSGSPGRGTGGRLPVFDATTDIYTVMSLPVATLLMCSLENCTGARERRARGTKVNYLSNSFIFQYFSIT